MTDGLPARQEHVEPYAVRVCARCGAAMRVGRDVCYVTNVEVFAAYDPEEIDNAALASDLRAEIEALCEKLKGLSREEAESSVYKRLSFFLCPKCQKRYVKNPAGG